MDELKEMLGNLSDKDWRERKEASFNISSSLELIIKRVSSITDSLIDNLINGNIDERYWSGEILGRLSPDYYGKKLMDDFVNNLADKEYFQVVRKIINSNFEWYSDLLKEMYYKDNDVLKNRIVEIASFYPREDFRDIYESALVSKYLPLIRVAVNALSDISDLDTFLGYSFVLNTNYTGLIICYFEKIISILKNEEMNFSEVLKRLSCNLRLEEKSDIIYFLSSNIHKTELLNSLKNEDYGVLSSMMILKRYSSDVTFEDISETDRDDILLVYFFLNIVNEDYNNIGNNISEISNEDIISFIVRDKKVSSNIPETVLEKIYLNTDNDEIRINILKSEVISKDSIIVEKVIEGFEDADKYTKIEIIRFLASFKDESFIPFFFKNLKDANWIVRKFAANCIIDQGEDSALYIEEYIYSDNKDISYWSHYCKIFLSTEKDVLFLKDMINNNTSFEIIRLAVKRVCVLNTSVSQEIIQELLKNSENDIKKIIYKSIAINPYFYHTAAKYVDKHKKSEDLELAEAAEEFAALMRSKD